MPRSAAGGAEIINFPAGPESSTVPTEVSFSTSAAVSAEEKALNALREIGAVPAKVFFERAGRRNPVRDRIRESGTKRAIGRMAQTAAKAGLLSPIALQRMNAGLTQTQLAARLGVPQSQVARWESIGQFERTEVGSLRRIAKALNVDITRFFVGSQE